MDYKMNYTQDETNQYLDKLVDKLYAVLGVYEDCSKKNDFDGYFKYLQRLSLELKGCEYSIGINEFLSLYNVILGMLNSDIMEHDNVKYLSFHCISIVKKMKVI